MKKLFIAILGVAAFAACSQDVTLETPKGAAIGFDNVFVENATKAAADISAANLANFGVYGSIINAEGAKGMIFNNQTVAKGAEGYSYSPAQYWVAATTYNFVALAPQTAANWTYANAENDAYNGVISFNNAAAAGEQDLLFASHGRTTADKLTAAPEKVAFTFNHMLSRVKFTFTNGFHQGSNVTLKITDVTITNAHAEGTLAVANGVVAEDWTGSEATFARLFGNLDTEILAENGGNGATEHYYLLPTATATYDITFTVALYQAGVLVDTYNRNATISIDLEKGKSYNFQATLNKDNTSDEAGELYPIEFTATVNDWAAFGDKPATVKEVVKVATAAELTAAIEAGNNVALTADINLDETRAAAGLILNNDVVIEGAGHTLTTSAVRAIQIINAKNVTIKNLTLNAGGERGIQLQSVGQTLIVENVKATSANRTINITDTCEGAVVAIKNCELKGLTPVNVWGKNNNVTVKDTKITLEDNNTTEGYAAIYNAATNNSLVTLVNTNITITGTAAEDTLQSLIANENTQTVGIKSAYHYYAINYPSSDRYTYATFEEAYADAEDGETIVVIKDVTLSNPLLVSKNIAVDLNGHTLTAPVFAESNGAVLEGDSDSYVFWVKEGATLTINGEGTVAAQNAKYSIAVWAQGGNVVINGGTYTNAGEGADLIYASAGGNVVINGGEFVACPKQAGVDGTLNAYSALNVKDADYRSGASDIVVYGGKFFQFNPADNASEGAGTNFVAAGYKSVADGEWYNVVAE